MPVDPDHVVDRVIGMATRQRRVSRLEYIAYLRRTYPVDCFRGTKSRYALRDGSADRVGARYCERFVHRGDTTGSTCGHTDNDSQFFHESFPQDGRRIIHRLRVDVDRNTLG
jgi:hypothetical protein